MKRPCAICENRIDLNTLCGDCRRDPVNRDWVESSPHEHATDEIEESSASSGLVHRDAIIDIKRTAIIEMWNAGRVMPESERREDDKGREHVRARVYCYSVKHIARVLNCSQWYVRRVITEERKSERRAAVKGYVRQHRTKRQSAM